MVQIDIHYPFLKLVFFLPHSSRLSKLRSVTRYMLAIHKPRSLNILLQLLLAINTFMTFSCLNHFTFIIQYIFFPIIKVCIFSSFIEYFIILPPNLRFPNLLHMHHVACKFLCHQTLI